MISDIWKFSYAVFKLIITDPGAAGIKHERHMLLKVVLMNSVKLIYGKFKYEYMK